MGEVYDGDPAYTCPYQDSLDSVLNYRKQSTLLARRVLIGVDSVILFPDCGLPE